MSPRPGRCPSCGEPVSAFAAGCAVCGTDLEAFRRRQAERRRVALPRPSGLAMTGDRGATIWIGVLALLAVFQPILGLLLAGWTAYDRDRSGETGLRNAALAVCAIALAMLLIPSVRFGLLQLIF